MGDIMEYDEASLLALPALGANSAKEIIQKRDNIIEEHGKDAGNGDPFSLQNNDKMSNFDIRLDPEYKDSILKYFREKDLSLMDAGLHGRPLNQLMINGYKNLSDIILLTEEDLKSIPQMGQTSVVKVLDCISKHVSENEARIRAFHDGDDSILWDDDLIKQNVLELFQERGFHGLSFKEVNEKMSLPEGYPEERLKAMIGQLIAAKEIEYVDFRLYRCYGKFEDYLETAQVKSERNKIIVQRRLKGETLAEIGANYDLTRERVRQIINKTYKDIQAQYFAETGLKRFDEEYYTYFYETYFFDKKEGSKWLNISPATWKYLDMLDVKQGNKSLNDAAEDPNIDVGLRLKIKNYINRNKVFIDGRWVEKKRYDLEEAAVRLLCKDNTSFDDFCDGYNKLLREHEVDFDENIYITDAVKRTRKNHLPNTNFLLWKQNEMIRYYDVDGRDYTELLEELDLDAYEDIELSTLKFMTAHPDIMQRYDIRDQYELHNLLRKIVPEGSYNDLKFGRMPMIVFGNFDRDAVVTEMLLENAPISANDFADLLYAEFGIDKATAIGSHARCIYKYLKDGIYTMDHKVMDPINMNLLKEALTEDFYFVKEIKEIYKRLVPSADLDEVNSYNLRSMGFTFIGNCILQNYTSLESYYVHLFTESEIVDIKKYKRRYGVTGNFYGKLMEMKRDLTVVEFEPDQIINFSRLERAGVTKDLIHEYCNEVYEFVGPGQYFSSQSIRSAGFSHELYDLGFSDWFYANLLLSDNRFSFTHIYGNIVLYTGSENITIASFQEKLVKNHGSIDVYDLMDEMEEVYGCTVPDKYDIPFKLKGTDVYYDSILDRLYANADVYEDELEAAEAI